jgi:adenylate cyclase
MLTAVFITVHEYLFLTNYPGVLGTQPMESYSFSLALTAAAVWAIMGGTLFSIIELFYLQRKLQNRSFINVVSTKLIIYFFMLVFINLATSLVYNSIVLQLPFWSSQVLGATTSFATSISFWHPLSPFILLLLLTLFIIQLNYKFGQGELWRYVRGKYFLPREEERIFLFLDIASSTSIAEKLGHIQFFNFINDFYKDITDTILLRRGEIVDYVGDEIIISWSLSNGLMNCNCLHSIFDIETTINALSEKYLKQYGVIPKFRSGLHYGESTVGEIGKIKKEVTYFGDVINTTARIQGLCKEKGEDIVISESLLERLPLNDFEFRFLGDIQLRGKSATNKVYGVSI